MCSRDPRYLEVFGVSRIQKLIKTEHSPERVSIESRIKLELWNNSVISGSPETELKVQGGQDELSRQ